MSTDESAYSQPPVTTVDDPTHRTKLLMDRRQRKIAPAIETNIVILRPGVWFATGEQIARHVKQQVGLTD